MFRKDVESLAIKRLQSPNFVADVTAISTLQRRLIRMIVRKNFRHFILLQFKQFCESQKKRKKIKAWIVCPKYRRVCIWRRRFAMWIKRVITRGWSSSSSCEACGIVYSTLARVTRLPSHRALPHACMHQQWDRRSSMLLQLTIHVDINLCNARKTRGWSNEASSKVHTSNFLLKLQLWNQWN